MHRIIMITLLAIPLPVLAGQLTAVISPTGKQVLDPGCREALAKTLGDLELNVLPKDADAVTGDLVVNVKIEAGCELLVFVTPTGKKLATVEKTGQDKAAACRSAAVALKDQLLKPLKQLKAKGLPHVVVLRWNDRIQPPPAMRLKSFFLKKGIKAKPTVQTASSCTFHFDSQESPAEFGHQLHSFLKQHYRAAVEPPESLPRARRSFMFLLRKP